MSDGVVESAGTVTDATHQPNPNEPGSETPSPSTDQSSTRPDWLPEKFENGEKLAEAYKNLEGKLRSKDEELRTSLIEEVKGEMEAQTMEGVPEDAAGYEVPEGWDADSAKDNPTWETFTNWAHERKLRQDDFNELVSLYETALAPNIEAERAKLGDDAASRIDTLSRWVGANVSEAHRDTILRMATTAENFQALEGLMRLTVPQGLPKSEGNTPTSSEALTEDSVRDLMQSPKYLDPTQRDPKVVEAVDAFFAAKYNTGS